MRRLLVVLPFVLLILYSPFANACGDKFLVLGRGLRYERAYPATHPASILIYSTDVKSSKELSKILGKAGHKVTNVPTPDQMFSTLGSSKYDVVLISIADAPAMERKIMETPSTPSVLPVIYKAQGSEFDTKAAEYPCILMYKDKNHNPIAVIDQVMDDRMKGKPMQCKWSK